MKEIEQHVNLNELDHTEEQEPWLVSNYRQSVTSQQVPLTDTRTVEIPLNHEPAKPFDIWGLIYKT